jgi:hypothetical protein
MSFFCNRRLDPLCMGPTRGHCTVLYDSTLERGDMSAFQHIEVALKVKVFLKHCHFKEDVTTLLRN